MECNFHGLDILPFWCNNSDVLSAEVEKNMPISTKNHILLALKFFLLFVVFVLLGVSNAVPLKSRSRVRPTFQ